MAYYCGECAVWLGSDDVNKYGERWCSYSRRYEKSNQNTYGCRGFVYVGRVVLTKVCEILHLAADEWFAQFDRVRCEYVESHCPHLLTAYAERGKKLADMLEQDQDREAVARHLLRSFLEPAAAFSKENQPEQAVQAFSSMVTFLSEKYQLA